MTDNTRNGNAASAMDNEQLFDAYRRVRGRKDDRRWAMDAAYALLFDQHASAARVHEALAVQLETFRNIVKDGDGSGDANGTIGTLAVLLGAPEQWAAQRADLWREEGIDAFDYDDTAPLSLRDVLVYAFGFGALATALFWFFMLFRVQDWGAAHMVWRALLPSPMTMGRDGGTLSMGWVAWSGPALPLVIALGVTLINAVYRCVLSAKSFALAVIAAGAVFIVSVAAGSALAMAADAGPRMGMGWMPVAAIAYGLIAYAVSRLWKVPAGRGAETVADDLLLGDDEWLAELTGLLRERNDMTDRDVARIRDEARAHASQSNASLVEKFGSPREYAHRFTPTPVSAGRETVYWAFAVIFAVIGIVWHAVAGETASWWSVAQLAMFLIAFGLALHAWHRRKSEAKGE